LSVGNCSKKTNCSSTSWAVSTGTSSPSFFMSPLPRQHSTHLFHPIVGTSLRSRHGDRTQMRLRAFFTAGIFLGALCISPC
jgi:hypothetical protein